MPPPATSGSPAEISGHAVVVDDLVIRYGATVAVDGLSFSAEAGAITVVLGPNGAGKTSTIEHLEGYRRSDSGSASVLGLHPLRDHTKLTHQVGLMLQQGGIPTGIRPPEVLRQYAGFFEHPLDPVELLAKVGLSERSRSTYRRLSGGEQQRLSLALAIIGRPRVVFLDEPTAGVDLEGRDLIRAVLGELRDDGVCVVVTTHDLDEAERSADHVVIIDRGRSVGSGSPASLMSNVNDHLLFGAPAGLDVASLSAAVGAVVVGATAVEVSPGEYRVSTEPSPRVVAAVTNWLADHDLQLADLRAERQRLDDVFRRLTSERSTSETSTRPGDRSGERSGERSGDRSGGRTGRRDRRRSR